MQLKVHDHLKETACSRYLSQLQLTGRPCRMPAVYRRCTKKQPRQAAASAHEAAGRGWARLKHHDHPCDTAEQQASFISSVASGSQTGLPPPRSDGGAVLVLGVDALSA